MLVASIFDVERTADRNWRVVLGEIVGVGDAAALHNAFLDIANAAGDVTVDCRATESIDASVLQLLIALQLTLTQSGRQLCLAAISEPLLARLTACGLPPTLLAK